MKAFSVSYKAVKSVFKTLKTAQVMMLWMITGKEKMTKSRIFNSPFLGSHTSSLGQIPLGYIWPAGLPTHQISSNSEGVMYKTLVNWYGITQYGQK